MRSLLRFFGLVGITVLVRAANAGQTTPAAPRPQFQGDFFAEMPRAFCVVEAVDVKGRALIVKLDRTGETRRVPIRDDTELHFRDSWGELSDYFPGQHVMLFMYVNEDRQWTYPRAVQDDIHMRARHNHFARVVRIDSTARTYDTEREEKTGPESRVVRDTVTFLPDAAVWKGEKAESVTSLRVGDEVIQQLVVKDSRLVAAEIMDRKGDDAVRAKQEARHRDDQSRLGLPSYVNDVDPISGSLVISIAWSGAERAKHDLKEGDVVAVVPVDGTRPFAATVCSLQAADTRERIQLLVNARSAARIAVGQPLRVFVPGTGPPIPTGRSGVPTFNR